MLIQKENQPINNNNEINRDEINNNLEEVNSNSNSNSAQNNNLNQNNNGIRNHGGFDIFLSHGLNAQEIRTLRLIFHFTAAQEGILNGTALDWSTEGIYQREERWLINQINGIYNRNRNRDDNNNQYISLNVNDGGLFYGGNNLMLFYDNQFDERFSFMLGFFVGFLTNVFGFLILFCRFKSFFKLGVICGMIISILCFFKIFYFK
jgi:hypothetical protein